VIPTGVDIFVGLSPVDLQWGFDRLAGFVQEEIGHAARSGALFVFFGKRKSALKICSSTEPAVSVLQEARSPRISRATERDTRHQEHPAQRARARRAVGWDHDRAWPKPSTRTAAAHSLTALCKEGSLRWTSRSHRC